MSHQQALLQTVRALCFIGFFLFGGEMQSRAVTAASSTATHPVWVLSNGFHSAVGLRATDAGPVLRRAARDPLAQWIVVGWGDKDFFMAKRVTPWIAIKAVFWPTPSALHVAPLRKPPESVYRRSAIVRLSLRPDELSKLQRYLEAQFAVDRQGHPVLLGPGFSEGSNFFLGTEKFYFPKMCNLWLAEGLRRAGVPVCVPCSITAQELIRQVKKYGVTTGGRQLPSDAF